MKSYMAGLLAGCLCCPALCLQVTNTPSGSENHQPLGSDSALRTKLVGVWSLSVTNPIRGDEAGQWMSTETKYRPDGTFEMQGQVGTIRPPEPPGRKHLVKRDG